MKLYFMNGEQRGEGFELAPPGIRIGREEDNDIQLLIAGVSRCHAKIVSAPDGQWQILDLGGAHGTQADGERIASPRLPEPGAMIMIGGQLPRFGGLASLAGDEPPNPRSDSAGKSVFRAPGCVAILIFSVIMNPKTTQGAGIPPPSGWRNPFLLEYEKTAIAKDGVFRFYVRTENGSATFELDDLNVKYQRHLPRRTVPGDAGQLKELVGKIAGDGFHETHVRAAGQSG